MQRVKIRDGELAVEVRGSGPTLLLVHGFPLDHSMWRAQLDALSDGYLVVAPDLRGFGASAATAPIPRELTMEQHAADLVALLDGLDLSQPVILCGLSMGGYVAWQFWKHHRSRLARLILCDTRAIADSPDAAKGRLETAAKVEREGTIFLADSMGGKLFAPETPKEEPAVVEATRKVMLAANPAGVAAALRGMAVRPDVTSWLPQIDVPTLALCGQHDAISPSKEMREFAGKIPGALFREVAAAGHMAPLEQPQTVNTLIRAFLTAP
jgi:pimeloyl-ACP methyl ester carboxylesterase